MTPELASALAFLFFFIALTLYVAVTKDWKLLLFLCGLWNVGDSLFSIMVDFEAKLPYQIVRILRLIIGLYLIALWSKMRRVEVV